MRNISEYILLALHSNNHKWGKELSDKEICLVFHSFLLVVLLAEYRFATLDPILVTLALSGLVWVKLGENRIYWFLVLLLVGISLVEFYYVADNHKFLIFYACLAYFLSIGKGGVNASGLRRSTFLLLGGCFALATLSKLNHEFLSGATLRYFMLTDERFGSFLGLAGISDTGFVTENLEKINSGLDFTLAGNGKLGAAPGLATVFTVASEAAAAAFFGLGLLKAEWRKYLYLSVFIFTLCVYPFLFVRGFAMILLCLLIPACKRRIELFFLPVPLLLGFFRNLEFENLHTVLSRIDFNF